MSPRTLNVVIRSDQSARMADTTTLTKLAHRWTIERVRRHEITPSTAARTRSIIASFADSYGRRPIANMSRRDIERWMETRSHLAPGTRRHEFSVVRQLCRHLVETGQIRRDPTTGVRPPKVPRPADRALSRDEVDRLEAVLPDARARAIFALMRHVGLRRAEVLALQVGDWDRRAETLQIVGKGGHHRTEPCPPWVAAPLASYLAETGAQAGPMIRTLDGSRGLAHSTLGRMMSKWMTDAGVKVAAFDGRNCHALRHTIASELIESGADICVVQELLGHQSITSTQVYLRRAAVERVRSAMSAANAA